MRALSIGVICTIILLLTLLFSWANIPDERGAVLLAGLPFVVAFGVILLGYWLLKAGPRRSLMSQCGSSDALTLVVIFAICFIVLVITVAWVALQRVEQRVRTNIAESLPVIVESTQESLNLWAEIQKEQVQQLTKDPRLITLVQLQLMVPRSKKNLLESKELTEMRAFFRRHRNRFGQAGFCVISPDFVNIASMYDANIGDKNLLAFQALDLLHRAFQGETVMVPPVWADLLSESAADDTWVSVQAMFFAAPIRNARGEVIAVVARRVDPFKDFTRLLQMWELGKTGETYAFDRYGKLLSESRFEAQLRRIGLLREDQMAILSVSLRDPGGNLLKGYTPSVPRYQQPLTFMAAQATKGKKGVNIEGYRDYRGVPVFGAWTWDDHLGIGLATKIDKSEALSTYYTMRRVIVTVLAITVFLALFSLFLAVLVEKKAARDLRKSHEELEHIVEQRTAELSESEERFALAVKGAGAGIWDLRLETGKAWYSERFHELLGYEMGEFGDTFSAWEESLHPDDRQAALAALQEHLEKRTPYFAEFRLRCKSGEYRWFRATGQALWDEDGKPLRMAGAIVDIEDRKHAQDQLRKLSRATENSPASVVITNKHGVIEYVNAKFTEVTGYTSEEALGQNPRILKSGKHDRQFYQELWRTILSGKIWRGEFQNRKKNGEIYWESSSIAPVFDEEGEITHFVAVKSDISDRKKMEEELIQARIAADNANKSKSEFLANMSHEIRTPMNAVIGMAHLALKTDLTPKQRDYLTKIESSAKSLLGIINDILDFSKIEAGKLDMEEVDFNLDSVLDNLANLITVKAQEKEDLEVLFSTASEVPKFLVGDPMRLGQVLLNLSNNAVKFTDSGEIVVSTEVVNLEKDKVTLKFSVRDTGVGLNQEQIDRLFQPFSQADTSTTRKYGGTGLGLTISQRLVEMMGGEIWVESEPGQGSTFHFTATFGLGQEVEKKRFVPPTGLRGTRVLVIDDNPTSRRIFREMLQSFSFQVTLAVSGEEGLAEIDKRATSQPFELVIMDWKMPGMDGIETARRIKRNPRLQKIPPIILVTAYGREEVIQEAERAGLDGFLLKPVSPSVLLDTIMESMGAESMRTVTAHHRRREEVEALENIRGAQVLLVDDNAINQQIAQEILEGAGLKVTVADNGQEAVNAVQEKEYDVILMDLQMPVMDGFEATRKIRSSRAEIRDIPIIAMTAHAMKGDREKCLEAGMNDHVTKPIDPEQLFAALVRWIKRQEIAAPVEDADQLKSVSDSAPHEAGAAEPAADGEEFLPDSLPGFDIGAGLARLQGNMRLYRKLLLDFSNSYAEAATEISEALAANDLDRAHHLVHSLKGVAGNLSAVELHAAAVEMEKLIKKGGKEETADSAEIEQKTAALEQALEKTLRSVQTLTPAAKEPDAESAQEIAIMLSAELAGEICSRLRQAAEMGDVMELTAVAEYLESRSESLAPISGRISKMAEEFDFEGISELADALEESSSE
ncbi:MAG: response regulator [Deltaproteobacteria bacterium]|nr:response regulator [Deltaproteobacteria bacterium]